MTCIARRNIAILYSCMALGITMEFYNNLITCMLILPYSLANMTTLNTVMLCVHTCNDNYTQSAS